MTLASGPWGRSGFDLGALLAQAHLEVLPLAGVEDTVAANLSPGSTVTVTCSPARGPERTVEVAGRIAKLGHRVVPHLSARTVRSRAHLEDLLGKTMGAGLRDLFVIGGDIPEPRGPYSSATQLLAAIQEIDPPGLDEVGVAGYPEGHPLISDEALLEALVAKERYATYVATQICFDVRVVMAWIARMRARGILLPVHVGMPGAVRRRKLLEISLRVGVGDSVRYLTKYGSLVARLMRRSGFKPDVFVAQLEPFLANPDHGIRGVHVYTFNQLESTERWRRDLLGAHGRAGPPIARSEEDTAS